MITDDGPDEAPTRMTRRVFFGALALIGLIASAALLVRLPANPSAPLVAQQPAVTCPDPAGLSTAGKLSERDSTGALIGETLDSTTIRALAPAQLRAGVEYPIRWTMTGTAPFMIYAAHAQGTMLHPTVTALASPEQFETRLTFPQSGCWQLHVWRGPDSGNVWVVVDP
jgi:hypothetical protein